MSDKKWLLSVLPFYKSSIDYGFRKIRPLDNAELLEELSFCTSLNKRLIKSNFRGFAKSYAIEKRYDDPLSQLRASKSTIKELFKELLVELHGFKFIITLVVILTKDHIKNDGTEETEYVTLYFNSLPKLVINEDFRDSIDLSFEEIINKIQNWIKDGSGRTVESVSGKYVNIGKYAPLAACSYIELPASLKNPKKGLINLKNKNKCFLWCHFRHLNSNGLGKNPSRITKEDKIIADTLDYSRIEFPVSLKYYPVSEDRFNINVNVFASNESNKESPIYSVYVSKKNITIIWTY